MELTSIHSKIKPQKKLAFLLLPVKRIRDLSLVNTALRRDLVLNRKDMKNRLILWNRTLCKARKCTYAYRTVLESTRL